MPCFNPDNLDSTGLLKGGQSVLGMKSPPAEPVESRHLRAAHLDDHGAELSTFNESNATDLGSSTIQMHHHHGTIEIQGGKAIQTPLNHDELVKGTRPDAADLASMRFTLSKSVAAQQQTNSRILQESGDGAEKQTKFGLLGLLDVIRMTNADLNTLALGSDLTTLGLNLNSAECLYSTFASPWAEAPTMREPQFSLPMCYYMQPPPLKTQHTCSLSHGACPQTSTIGLTSPSSNSKPSSTYFMPCQRTFSKPTLHKNCTIVTGNTTKT
jgi:hypothetical protein